MHSGKAGLQAVNTKSTATIAAAQTECSPVPTTPVQEWAAAPGACGPAGPPAVLPVRQDREHASGEELQRESLLKLWLEKMKESCSLRR